MKTSVILHSIAEGLQEIASVLNDLDYEYGDAQAPAVRAFAKQLSTIAKAEAEAERQTAEAIRSFPRDAFAGKARDGGAS